MDYTKLYKAYSRNAASGKATPEAIFKMLVYGYMTGNYSSRKIEEACKTNINFMWLLDGAKAPDHIFVPKFRNQNRFTQRTKRANPDTFQIKRYMHLKRACLVPTEKNAQNPKNDEEFGE